MKNQSEEHAETIFDTIIGGRRLGDIRVGELEGLAKQCAEEARVLVEARAVLARYARDTF